MYIFPSLGAEEFARKLEAMNKARLAKGLKPLDRGIHSHTFKGKHGKPETVFALVSDSEEPQWTTKVTCRYVTYPYKLAKNIATGKKVVSVDKVLRGQRFL